MASRVRVRDNGYNALMKRLQKAFTNVTVGVHAEEGAKAEGESTVAEVMTYHELGLGVPQRSWLRGWFDENAEASFDELRRLCAEVTKGSIPSIEAAALKFGDFAVEGIKARMDAGIAPASLVDGRTIHLKDSETAYDSISAKVKK